MHITPNASLPNAAQRRVSSIDEAAPGINIVRAAPHQYLPDEQIEGLIAKARVAADSHPEVMSLARYRAMAQGYLEQGYQADQTVGELDIQNLPLLIAAENARIRELDLVWCADNVAWQGVISRLLECAAQGQQARARVIERAWSWGRHHIYADLLALPGHPLSVIEFETIDHVPINPTDLAKKLEHWGIPHRHSTVMPRLQKSDNDCVIFSISLALKAFAHRDHLHSLHLRQLGGHMNAQHAGNELPVGFYKHLQSSTTLSWRLRTRPELGLCTVNRLGEKLRARCFARLAKTRSGQIYNISIELKRLALIDRAIRHFGRGLLPQAAPEKKSGWQDKLLSCWRQPKVD